MITCVRRRWETTSTGGLPALCQQRTRNDYYTRDGEKWFDSNRNVKINDQIKKADSKKEIEIKRK